MPHAEAPRDPHASREPRDATRAADPVSLGSDRSRAITTDSCLVTESWFPAHAVLAPHRHARGLFAVMLEGSFEAALWHRRLACTPAMVWTEPAEERHANYVGSGGAHVIVVQPDPERTRCFEPFTALTTRSAALHDPFVAADAHRIADELAHPDSLSAVTVDSLVLLMMASASRTWSPGAHAPRIPPWLARAREFVRAAFLGGFRLSEVAAEVDVHPSHLAHAFRRHYRTTMGQYARGLRLRWAVDRVRTTGEPLARIAHAAGYSDQAHFSRECKRSLGVSPSHLRRRAEPEQD